MDKSSFYCLHLTLKDALFLFFSTSNNRFRKDPRQLDDDEENWFNNDDNDDDNLEDSPSQLLDSDLQEVETEKVIGNSVLHSADNTSKVLFEKIDF